MAINFPESPNVNDVHTESSLGKTWRWDGTSWKIYTTSTSCIGLSDLSVSQQAVGAAALTYSNTTGVFTYTPPDLSTGTARYTITIDSLAFDELNNGEIEIEVPGGSTVSDSAGNVGPDSTIFFRFVYDTTRPQLEETAAGSPAVTNSGTPTVSIRAQDTYSDADSAIEMRAYLWNETNSYWNDNELVDTCLLYTSPSPRDRG